MDRYLGRWQWLIITGALLLLGVVFVYQSPAERVASIDDRRVSVVETASSRAASFIKKWREIEEERRLMSSAMEVRLESSETIPAEYGPGNKTVDREMKLSPLGLNLFMASQQIEKLVWPLMAVMGLIMTTAGIIVLREHFRKVKVNPE